MKTFTFYSKNSSDIFITSQNTYEEAEARLNEVIAPEFNDYRCDDEDADDEDLTLN